MAEHNHITRNMDEPGCPACEAYVASLNELEKKNSSTPLETRGAAVGKFTHTSGRVIR